MKAKLSNPKALTKAQAKELELTGMVIVGDRIIRTAAYIARVQRGAEKMISTTAARLFS